MSNPLQVTKVRKCLFLPPLYSQGTSYFLDSGKQLQTGEAGKGRREEGKEGGRIGRREEGREERERWGLWEDRREEEGKRKEDRRKRGQARGERNSTNSTISCCT